MYLLVNFLSFKPGKTTSISTARAYLYGLILRYNILQLLTLLILLGLLQFLIVVFFVLSKDLDEFEVNWISWALRYVKSEW